MAEGELEPADAPRADGAEAATERGESDARRETESRSASASGAREPPAVTVTHVPKAMVPRWIQLVALPLLVLALLAVAVAAGPVLLIFAVAAVLALILNP